MRIVRIDEMVMKVALRAPACRGFGPYPLYGSAT